VSAADAAQIIPGSSVLSDTVFLWLQVLMVVGIALAVIATYLTARANKRLNERIRRRREQRRAQADTVSANIDALAGRPVIPPSAESGERELED
jgi:membrane protein implicated in regulation of membrane protease activity